MTQLSLCIGANQCLWQAPELSEQVTDDWFSQDFWHKQGKLTGSASGRGTTHFIAHNDSELVLRHYCRGGLVGRFNKDRYLFTGWKQSRALREVQLLLSMQTAGLAVPLPIAARVIRSGLYYRADIIIEKIPGARDIHQHLLQSSLTAKQWQKTGEVIAAMHSAQVYHHDLNIHNIMLDDQSKIWLIDFDKCGIKPGENWKADNLGRLLRSLKKEKGKYASYHFNQDNWQALLEGYNRVTSSC